MRIFLISHTHTLGWRTLFYLDRSWRTTGSIGVLAGKMNMKGLYEQHLGINYDSILTSENASLNSSLHAYTDAQTSFMERVVVRITLGFLSRGRGSCDE